MSGWELGVGSVVIVNRNAATKYHGAIGVIKRLPEPTSPQVKIKLARPERYEWGDGTGHAWFAWSELDPAPR